MKSLIIALILGLSLVANANDNQPKVISAEESVHVSYFNNNSAYACSYAESRLKKVLKTVGAESVDTDCRGGIEQGTPSWTWKSIDVSASYSKLVSVESTNKEAQDARWETVVIRGRDACDFNVKLINAVLDTVEHKLVKKSSSCWDSSGNYRFEIEVLKKN